VSMQIPTLHTARLALRPFAAAEAADVQRLAGAAEVAATTLNLPHPYLDGMAETWIAGHEERAEQGIGLTWAIVRRDDAVLLGAISLGLHARHPRGGLGYWLGVTYWNQGYTTEAAYRVITYGFAERGLYRIEAGCFPRNRASSRVMEKIGMRYEGTLRGYLRKGETMEDVAMYAVLRSEFPQQGDAAGL
jgi:[ribosomal protein S5]-alanine N-acetyltransferase